MFQSDHKGHHEQFLNLFVNRTEGKLKNNKKRDNLCMTSFEVEMLSMRNIYFII